MPKRHSVLWFVILTLVLSIGTYFLPLSSESKSLVVPLLLAFVPTVVAIPVAFLTEGRGFVNYSPVSAARGGGP